MLEFKEFPKERNELLALAQTDNQLLVKISKGSDSHFNPKGYYLGSMWGAGEYEDIVFSTSMWDMYYEQYIDLELYPITSTKTHEVTFTIEDIEEYIIL